MRKAQITRKTAETDISVEIDLDTGILGKAEHRVVRPAMLHQQITRLVIVGEPVLRPQPVQSHQGPVEDIRQLGDQLLLEPANWQHFAAQRDFTGHRYIRANRDICDC